MTPSQACIDLIKRFEGFVPKAYVCPAGVLTIACGHTGLDVLPGQIVTQAQGEALLKSDVERFSNVVNKALTRPVTQGQFDALVSFCFNLGPGKKGVKDGLVTLKSGNTSTLLRKTNEGDKLGAAAEFPKWATAGGVVLKGLVTRREAEQRLYLS
jgi:lysozyme